MSTDDQEQRTGGIPHAFGNRVAWQWADAMPAYLKRGFLTMLYAMRQHAAPSGELVFNSGDRKPIKLSVLARSAGCREKDGRRLIEAAVRAGVVAVVGERRRGKATLYRLVVTQWPDWKAAEDYLRATSRAAGKKITVEDEKPETSGHSGPNPQGAEGVQGPAPEGATVAPMTSGHSGPNGSGHSGPNIPCVTHAGIHDGAEVGTQPEVVGGSAGETNEPSAKGETRPEERPPADGALGRCEICDVRLVRPGRTRCSLHAAKPDGRRKPSAGRRRPVQAPLLMPVPNVPDGPSVPLQAPSSPSPAPDPFAAVRICGCGREYRDRQPGGRCPDCIHLAREEADRLGLPYQEARNA
ncbi:hypothetical protein [Streptomyces sp. NPDC059063]|uniref:hypothetical protein n=1 Tax=Streptomyces sp. NPDC059063 TaxID=3346712 RepID=UPI0036AE8167